MTQAAALPPLTTPTAARVLSHSAYNGVCYALAQGINFLVQLVLVRHLGKTTFGTIGLAQMCVTSLIFIAELGMPSYFIREASIRSNWLHQWQRACLLRGLVIGLGALGLLIFWRFYYGVQLPGFRYLLWAIPGMAVSVLNPTPLLIAQARAKTAAAGLLVLWIVYAVAAMIVLLLPTAVVDGGLGAAFSLGYIAFTIFLWRRVRWETSVGADAHAHGDMLKRSLTLWVPGLLGTLYALLLTFSIQHLLPGILAYVVLGLQLLQGISGLNIQLQRVLLSALASEHRQQQTPQLVGAIFALCGRLALAITLGLFALLCLLGFITHDPLLLTGTRYFCFMLAERLIGLMCAFLTTSLLARHREYFVFRVMVVSYLLSMAVQCALTYASLDLLTILIVRVITSLLQMLLFYRAQGDRLSGLSLVGAAAVMLLGCVPYSPTSIAVMGAVCVLISAALCLLALRDFIALRRR